MNQKGLNTIFRFGWVFISFYLSVGMLWGLSLGLPFFLPDKADAGEPADQPVASETIPKRVVSLGPIITENIYLLGAEDALIADTTYCIVPEAAKNKEKVGSLIQMNVEKIIRLHPDLVLGSSFTKSKQIQLLKKFNLPVIKFENPKTFDDMCAMTMRIGKILGKTDKALEIVTQAKSQVEAIIKKTAPLKKKKVFFQIGIKPLHTTIKGTFVNEYIEFAGGINIANIDGEGQGLKSEKYNREKVLERNPDVILIAMMGTSRKAAENEKAGWLRFQSINASRNHEIYILDPDIVCSPTPVTFIEALNLIVTKLHHEL